MPSRPYHSPVRDDAVQATVQRIVEATVALHAERGALGTAHADIAERAGVSVPTVYKHFPTRASLLPACMGHVAQRAPHVDEAALAAIPDLDARLDALVAAVHARHAHYEPWARWAHGEAARLPELAAALAERDADLRRLVVAVLSPAFRGRPPRTLVALAHTLLHFTAWQRLRHELADDKAVRRTVALVLRLAVHHATSERRR